jgi:hypothetical protein
MPTKIEAKNIQCLFLDCKYDQKNQVIRIVIGISKLYPNPIRLNKTNFGCSANTRGERYFMKSKFLSDRLLRNQKSNTTDIMLLSAVNPLKTNKLGSKKL